MALTELRRITNLITMQMLLLTELTLLQIRLMLLRMILILVKTNILNISMIAGWMQPAILICKMSAIQQKICMKKMIKEKSSLMKTANRYLKLAKPAIPLLPVRWVLQQLPAAAEAAAVRQFLSATSITILMRLLKIAILKPVVSLQMEPMTLLT